MRAKTSDFLKVLNRARPEPKNVEKKTITWVLILQYFKHSLSSDPEQPEVKKTFHNKKESFKELFIKCNIVTVPLFDIIYIFVSVVKNNLI